MEARPQPQSIIVSSHAGRSSLVSYLYCCALLLSAICALLTCPSCSVSSCRCSPAPSALVAAHVPLMAAPSQSALIHRGCRRRRRLFLDEAIKYRQDVQRARTLARLVSAASADKVVQRAMGRHAGRERAGRNALLHRLLARARLGRVGRREGRRVRFRRRRGAGAAARVWEGGVVVETCEEAAQGPHVYSGVVGVSC